MSSLLAALLLAPAPPAAQVIADAQARAAKSGKNVLVRFTASWCPWCRRFERLLSDPALGPRFADSYEVATVTVRERAERRQNENPGWEPIMLRLRGSKEQDIPYLAILSSKGEKLVDSYRGPAAKIPGNAGYPQTPGETTAFLDLVRRTGKGFDAQGVETLRAYLAAK